MDARSPIDADDGARIDAILSFWFGRPGDPDHGKKRKIWFEQDTAFDSEIRARFAEDVARAAAGALDPWQTDGRGALALVLLLDQFPRNLYRGDPRAYSHDAKARGVARRAIEQGFDKGLPPPVRMFFYLPFEHSENLADQERSLALMTELGDDDAARESRKHAAAHHRAIARFGRFPHRNAVLGRTSTAEEEAFLKDPDNRFGGGGPEETD